MWLINLVLVVLAGVALFYLLMPLLIKKQQRIPAGAKDLPVLAEQMLPNIEPALAGWQAELAALGFEHCASSMFRNGQVQSFFSLYKKADDDCVAMLVLLISDNAAMNPVTYVEFGQLYQDGWCLLLNNSPMMTAYPPLAEKTMLRLPACQSLAPLWQSFLQARTKLAANRLTQSWRAEDALDLVDQALAVEAAVLARRGYCEQAGEAQSCALTLKGAYYMTWKQLPPFKQRALKRELQQVQRVLGG